MRVSFPREVLAGEHRVAATPETVGRLIEKLGFEVTVETGAGALSQFPDQAYVEAGATIAPDAAACWAAGDIIAKIHAPDDAELALLGPGKLLIALLWPLQNPDLIAKIAATGCSALSLDRIPRITRSQKMDVLSSQANIAGYRAVVEAAHHLPRFFSGQITAAGKTPPAKVLIIGAGVAGLAAIGAARGLGAEVYAFDVRAAAREQVQSLGGKFLEVNLKEDGDGGGGYAKQMSQAFTDAQLALFREYAPKMDIVISTALIPGKPAPKLWTTDMVQLMKPGSVVVDLAASQGGNCELTVPGESVIREGVHIVGYNDLTSRLPSHASQFFASNIWHLLDDMGGGPGFKIDLGDEVIRSALQVHDGKVLEPPPPPDPSPPPKPKEPEAEKKPEPKPERAEKKPMTHGHGGPPAPANDAANPMIAAGTLGAAVALAFAGQYAPGDFLQHFTVFVLACFVGWQVVWNVTAALHTPLMSVTNAISGIILVGGIIQAGTGHFDAAGVLGALAILFASINIAGGFLVTQRMLAMFRK